MQSNKGFTLIELLIVVAIIAILAAIAVPNFLEAQTRAKVSRVRADMRSAATAIEAYAVDNNRYPRPVDAFVEGVEWGDDGPPFHSRIPSHLTTPIAYITTLFHDPFDSANPTGGVPLNEENVWRRFRYWNYDYFNANLTYGNLGPNTTFRKGNEAAGKYLMYSVGPDTDQANLGASFYTDYDATNGTVSAGNVFRSQKRPEALNVDL